MLKAISHFFYAARLPSVLGPCPEHVTTKVGGKCENYFRFMPYIFIVFLMVNKELSFFPKVAEKIMKVNFICY
jgi:hypothetical protein